MSGDACIENWGYLYLSGDVTGRGALINGSCGSFDLQGYNATFGSLSDAGCLTNSSDNTSTVTLDLADGTTSFGQGIGNNINVDIESGILQMDGCYGLGALTIGSGGTLDLDGYGAAVSSLSGYGIITDSSCDSPTSTLSVCVSSGNSCEFYGVIQDGSSHTVALNKDGPGTLILGADNTYTGGTTISNGTLQLGDGSSYGSVVGDIVNNASLEFDYSSVNRISANDISGNGTLTINNYGGTLSVTGDSHNYSGEITLSSGTTLEIDDGGTIGSGPVTGSGILVFNHSNGLIVANAISGSLSIEQEGSGTLTLSGNNDYTGGTNVSGGTLAFTNGGLGSTSSLEFTDNATLQWLPNNDQDISCYDPFVAWGVVATLDVGNSNVTFTTPYLYGSITKDGTGTLTISGNNVFECATIAAGTLVLSGNNTIDNVTINHACTLQVPDTDSLTLTNPLVNQGSLVVAGAGVFNQGNKDIHGNSAALSGTEAAISWGGLGSGTGASYKYQASIDGGNTWHDLTDGVATDSASMVSGLAPNENYTLRTVATNADGGQEIYESAPVNTSLPDESGWYRIESIVCTEVIVYYGDPSDDYDAYPGLDNNVGDELDSNAQSNAYIANSDDVPTGSDSALSLHKPTVHTLGSLTPPPLPFTNSSPSSGNRSFAEDNSWVYAGSPQGAIMQSLSGLVTDGSMPTIDSSGSVTLTQVFDDVQGYDCYTFDADKYPIPQGGVSAVVHYIYKVIYDYFNPDPTSPNPPCPCQQAGMGGSQPPGGQNTGPSTETDSAIVPMNSIDSTGGCSTCGTGTGGLTYDSRQSTLDTGYGPGWTDSDELPVLVVARNSDTVIARFGAEQAVWFDEQTVGSSTVYVARYGAQDTLVHDTTDHLFILTKSDGTYYEFFDSDQTDPVTGELHPQGGLYREVAPSGATIEVTAWTTTGRIAEVQYKTSSSPSCQAYQEREFTYVTTDDGIEHIQTITLQEYDSSAWTNVRRITYEYYATGDSYGLPGNLKKIVTQQWTNDAWSDYDTSDTDYFRYYTTTGYEHLLERVTLANAYAALYTATNGHPENATESLQQGQVYMGNYTCFYYEYDSDGRVTKKVVFGDSDESDFTNSLSGNPEGFNNWYRKCVETKFDASENIIYTNTIYTNYIGETILTDLYDAASNTHTITYNRYDDDGHLILTAEPSAFVTNGPFYSESYPDLVNYSSGDSPYLSDTAGLFQITTYYNFTSSNISETTRRSRGLCLPNGRRPRRRRRPADARLHGRADPAVQLHVLRPYGRRSDDLSDGRLYDL